MGASGRASVRRLDLARATVDLRRALRGNSKCLRAATDDSQRPGQKGQTAGGASSLEARLNRNFFYVMAGLLIGVALGIASYYSFPDKATAAEVAKYMSLSAPSSSD